MLTVNPLLFPLGLKSCKVIPTIVISVTTHWIGSLFTRSTPLISKVADCDVANWAEKQPSVLVNTLSHDRNTKCFAAGAIMIKGN